MKISTIQLVETNITTHE